jgi:hypothetical protein
MRNDQVEELAGEIAEAVAKVALAAGLDFVPLNVASHIAKAASEAARNAARQGVAKLTAVRIEADTANVKDLRTR